MASWQLTNTVGHISAYLGNKMEEPFDTGDFFESKDGTKIPRNSQFPIVVLKAKKVQLDTLAKNLQNSKLLFIVYVQDMIDLGDDEKLATALKAKNFQEMDIIGIGIFGLNDDVKKLTGELKLWK